MLAGCARPATWSGADRRPRTRRAGRGDYRPARGAAGRRLRHHHVPAGRPGRLRARHRDPAALRRGAVRGRHVRAGRRFRALRTIPVLLDLCAELDEVAPDALLLNYVNPMAANCWAVDRATGRPHVGLCHSVQGTSEMLAGWLGVPYDEVVFRCAGINHQAFFLLPARRRGSLPADAGGRSSGRRSTGRSRCGSS